MLKNKNLQCRQSRYTAIKVADGSLLCLFSCIFLQTSNIFLKRDGQAYYYNAQPSSRVMITVEQLLDAVCEETTLNRDEARTAVNRIFKKAGDFIELGFSVHLGDLGYIHVTLKSDGANTPGEVTATRVTDIVPRFVFGKKTARQYQNAKVQIRKGRQCGTYHDIIPVRTRCYSGTHRIIAGLRGNSLI